MVHALAIDLEDWFHPVLLAQGAGTLHSLIREPTKHFLHLLAQHGVHATFFIVGEVALQHPDLIHAIATQGHEIGCHGHTHTPLGLLDGETFREELSRAEQSIVAACGIRPTAFRGASFGLSSKTRWAAEILAEMGYLFDSSVMPSYWSLAGWAQAPRIPFEVVPGLWEVPASTSSRLRIPYGGSVYLRFLPKILIRRWVEANAAAQLPSSFYIHPWELLRTLPPTPCKSLERWITLLGQSRVEPMIQWLLDTFDLAPMGRVFERFWRHG